MAEVEAAGLDANAAPVAVLHIAPSHVDIRPGQGSHKDVAARKAFLMQIASSYRYCNVNGDNPTQLDAVLSGFAPTHVLIEYSYFPRIAREIRKRFPGARLAVRAHNIEPLQHWTLAGPGERDLLLPLLRCAYVTLRLFLADVQMARLVDRIFTIAPTEARQYWQRLGAGPKTSWLPYLPPPALQQAHTGEVRRVIACLPGGTESRRTRDLVNRFASFAKAAQVAGWKEQFVVTGDLAGWDVELNAAVELAGYVKDLPAFYRTVAAVAVLSPLGFGFKTTIGDALASGATVLLHPGIWSGLPDELKPYSIEVNSLKAADLDEVHSRLREIAEAGKAMDALNRRFDIEMTSFIQNMPKCGVTPR